MSLHITKEKSQNINPSYESSIKIPLANTSQLPDLEKNIEAIYEQFLEQKTVLSNSLPMLRSKERPSILRSYTQKTSFSSINSRQEKLVQMTPLTEPENKRREFESQRCRRISGKQSPPQVQSSPKKHEEFGLKKDTGLFDRTHPKKVLTSPKLLIELEHFTKKKIKEEIASPEAIVILFIDCALLSFFQIKEKIKTCSKNKDRFFLKQWESIFSTQDFLKKSETLKKKQFTILASVIGGEEVLNSLKECTKKKSRRFLMQYVKNLFAHYEALTRVNAQSVYLPTYFDRDQPIANIGQESLLLTLHTMYKDSYKKSSFITLNDSKIQSPIWNDAFFFDMNDIQKEKYFLEWLIGHLYQRLRIPNEHNAIAANHASLISTPPLSKKKIQYLVKYLGSSFKKMPLQNMECLCFANSNFYLITVTRLNEIRKNFHEWFQTKLASLAFSKIKKSPKSVVIKYKRQKQFILSQYETDFLESIIRKSLKDDIDTLEKLLPAIMQRIDQYIDLSHKFYLWSVSHLNEVARQEGISAILIVARYVHDLWYQVCHELPCLYILQAISLSAFAQGHQVLSEKYPKLVGTKASHLSIEYFPKNKKRWLIQIETDASFSATLMKTYHFILHEENMFGEKENKHYGTLDIKWTLQGHISEPIFSAELGFSNSELFDTWPLEKRNKFIDALL